MTRRQIFVDEAAGEEVALPVPPGAYAWNYGNEIGIVPLEQLGNLHLPGRRKLATQTVDCMFPAQEYPFAEPGAAEPGRYVEWFRQRARSGAVLRYIVTGTDLNAAVIIEDFNISEKDGTNDVYARITLREYEAPQTPPADADTPMETRSSETAAVTESAHTVVRGDTLWALCRKYYGQTSMALCNQVGKHNSIKNVNLIYVGQVIRFPPLSSL